MRTKEIHSTFGDAVVRTANRKTPIVEALYNQVLRAASPELANIALPSTETDLQAMASNCPLPLIAIGVINAFVPLAARLVSAQNVPFQIGRDGRFTDSELALAYEHFSNEDTNEGFWCEVEQAIKAVDMPLSPVESAPPETLTEAQAADPK